MSEKQESKTQMAIRFPDSFLARLDKLAEQMSEPGMPVTRVEVLRFAAFRGVTELEVIQELNLKPGKKKR